MVRLVVGMKREFEERDDDLLKPAPTTPTVNGVLINFCGMCSCVGMVLDRRRSTRQSFTSRQYKRLVQPLSTYSIFVLLFPSSVAAESDMGTGESCLLSFAAGDI